MRRNTQAHLLRTALANAASGPNAPALIERSAYISQLPDRLVPQFRRVANTQGAELVKLMDRWLEKRRGVSNRSQRKSRSRLAGVHVFGFLE